MTSGPEPTTPSRNPHDRPVWRQHFPVEVDQEAKATRREFAGALVVSAGAMCCGQWALSEVAPSSDAEADQIQPTVTLNRKFDDLRDGEALLFHYPDHGTPCLLIRLNQQVFAYEQKCTHLACPVIPDVQTNRLLCPCHRGSFDLQNGTPTAGPPRRGLPRIRIERRADGTLVATGRYSGDFVDEA